jgi:hypothetical protein
VSVGVVGHRSPPVQAQPVSESTSGVA